MTIRIVGEAATRARTVVRFVHWLTLIIGAALLASPIMESVVSALAQWSGEMQLTEATENAQEMVVTRTPAVSRTGGPAVGTVLSRFEIPRLKLSYILREGAEERTLARSIGHVEGTGLPGEAGNISIAGHRNTHFRKLEWIRRGDEVVLTSPGGTYRYRVEWIRLFTPEDVEVLDGAHGPAITLITCFPFEYVGSAPMRFVVRALPDADTRDRLGHPQGNTTE